MQSLLLTFALATATAPATSDNPLIFEKAPIFVEACSPMVDGDFDKMGAKQASTLDACAGFLMGVAYTISASDDYAAGGVAICTQPSSPRVLMKRIVDSYKRWPEAKNMSAMELVLKTYTRTDKCDRQETSKTAQPLFATAKDLTELCRFAVKLTSEDGANLTAFQAGQGIACLGYAAGFGGAVNAQGTYDIGGFKVCASPTLTALDLAKSIVKSADSNPDVFKDPPMNDPRMLALWAMKELHDCPK